MANRKRPLREALVGLRAPGVHYPDSYSMLRGSQFFKWLLLILPWVPLKPSPNSSTYSAPNLFVFLLVKSTQEQAMCSAVAPICAGGFAVRRLLSPRSRTPAAAAEAGRGADSGRRGPSLSRQEAPCLSLPFSGDWDWPFGILRLPMV